MNPATTMKVFSDMPPHSRVWIYQADRQLSESEQQRLHELVEPFVEGWQAHGKKLNSRYAFLYNTFLILMVDEGGAMASGCSIDDSVHTIQQLEKELSVDFMNRMVVTYRDGETLKHATMNDFWALIKAGRVTQETIVFNNLISSKKDLDENWEVPLSESWHKQIFS